METGMVCAPCYLGESSFPILLLKRPINERTASGGDETVH